MTYQPARYLTLDLPTSVLSSRPIFKLPTTSIPPDHLFTNRSTLSNHNNAVLTCSPRRRCLGSCSGSSCVSTNSTSIEAFCCLKQWLTVQTVFQPAEYVSLNAPLRARVVETPANMFVYSKPVSTACFKSPPLISVALRATPHATARTLDSDMVFVTVQSRPVVKTFTLRSLHTALPFVLVSLLWHSLHCKQSTNNLV